MLAVKYDNKGAALKPHQKRDFPSLDKRRKILKGIDSGKTKVPEVWSRGLGKMVPLYKKKDCLDCGKKVMLFIFNQETDRYEGDHLCHVCVQSPKRQFIE